MIVIYTSPTCHKCKAVKDFLRENKIEFKEINALENMEKMREIVEKTGLTNLPIIEMNGEIFSVENIEELKEKLNKHKN